MFAKLSQMSFIYGRWKSVYFSDESVKKIYQKYLIKKVYVGSTCLKFVFVSSTNSDIPDKKYRDNI